MKSDLTDKALRSEFRRTVEELSGQNLSDCYQCGKCSGGCPVLPDIEISPNRIIRMVLLGLEDEALGSESIWYCIACGTCNGRCPMGIDIIRIMDALRYLTRDIHHPRGSMEVWTFYQAFLDCVRQFGRLSEIGLMGGYNINSGRLLTNMVKAPWFFMKGKLTLSPHTIKRTDRLQRVFQRVKEIEGK
jgi:heterodisulfide reductase subunit C